MKTILALCIVASTAACSNATGFINGKVVKERVASSDQESEFEPVLNSISVEIPALELTQFNLAELFPSVDIKRVLSDEIGGWMSTVKDAPLRINALPDLQDMGSAQVGQWMVETKDSDYQKIELSLTAITPRITTAQCLYQPPPVIGSVQPALKWHWKGYETDDKTINYATTYSSPVVGDLDSDGNIEVVSIASPRFPNNRYAYSTVPALMVALNAEDGSVEWNSIKDSNIMVESSTTPAIADLDHDGFAEIITTRLTPLNTVPETYQREVLIIDYKTKQPKYIVGDLLCGTDCMPAVADINYDGFSEIVVGNLLISHTGTTIAKLGEGIEGNFASITNRNATSLAELDPASPGMEIISNGSQVYSSIGKLLWKGVCEGFSAVADIDRDGSNDLICIGRQKTGETTYEGGKVYRYRHNGELMWRRDLPQDPTKAPINPERFRGGAPNLGNFDQDPNLEIGTAGGDFYVVFRADGSILWTSATKDRSSHGTGSTVFDFNGDGKVEVVYNDELKLRIYDGSTGTILFEADNYSGTLWEYPLVANVDSTPSVEIILSAPGSNLSDPNQGGVKLFVDPSQKWVTSTRVWNQYSYYPTIISENLRAPLTAPTTKAGFRVNAQQSLALPDKISAPDLSVRRQLAQIKLDDQGRFSGKFFVSNDGMLESSERWKLILSAADSQDQVIELSTQDGSVIKSGAYRIFDFVDIAAPAGAKDFSAKIVVDNSEAGSDDCSNANSSVAIDIKN
jgi:hypothetical protein